MVQKRYRKYFKKLNAASEKKAKLEKEKKPVDADTLASLRDLDMQLEEIHYLTVEFQKWDQKRVAEEAKKEEAVPETPVQPEIDVDQIWEEAAEAQKKESAAEFKAEAARIQKKSYDDGFQKGLEEGTAQAK